MQGIEIDNMGFSINPVKNTLVLQYNVYMFRNFYFENTKPSMVYKQIIAYCIFLSKHFHFSEKESCFVGLF